MSDDIIKRLREAIAAGPTPGPWGASNPMSDVHSVSGPEHWQGVCRAYGRANCVYIAAASPDNIAALLDRLDKAERVPLSDEQIDAALQTEPEAILALADVRGMTAGTFKQVLRKLSRAIESAHGIRQEGKE